MGSGRYQRPSCFPGTASGPDAPRSLCRADLERRQKYSRLGSNLARRRADSCQVLFVRLPAWCRSRMLEQVSAGPNAERAPVGLKQAAGSSLFRHALVTNNKRGDNSQWSALNGGTNLPDLRHQIRVNPKQVASALTVKARSHKPTATRPRTKS